MECKLKRFYKLTELELEQMPMDRVMMYWKGVDMIEAQESIMKLRVADYPNMDVKDKKTLMASFEKKAFFKQEIKIVKTSDIAAFLGG